MHVFVFGFSYCNRYVRYHVCTCSLQSHIGIMVGALVLTIVGLIVIIVHAGGAWLTTTVR